MAWSLPLPEVVADRIERCRKEAPAGLLLDKYVRSWHPNRDENDKFSEKVQRPTVEEVVQASQKAPAGFDFDALRKRWSVSLRAVSFTASTCAPLALHLARASALENAGICLHPLYGFAYLPGSGLKGMARAFAKTMAGASAEETFAVFGNEPGARDDQAAGQIVFHDAWPVEWPKLLVDIVNNHHGDYYSAADGDNTYAPGDWENPVPVYFLAVAPGTKFEFALAKRRGDVADILLELARSWLAGALEQLGAGAKTAAGYGAFKVVPALRDGNTAVAEGSRASPPRSVGATFASPPRSVGATFQTTLELVTPAFLAGASQDAADCDLRGATLRGLLRWWWRTLHAGHVDVATLRRLEAAVWGDTHAGSPVRIAVEPDAANPRAQAYDRRAIKEMSPHEKAGDYGIPNSKPEKTTQGLWYASYGMDEKNKRRMFLSPGCKWTLRVAARPAGRLSAQVVIDQAKSALWLLTHYGGVGSRARKGFGSLSASLEGWSVERCREVARAARRAFGCEREFRKDLALSPSLEQALSVIEIPFAWSEVWDVLDQVGFAYQAFAKRYAHQREKKALGLPRRIGRTPRDVQGIFRPGGPVEAAGEKARHTSPVHIHLAKHNHGYLVRVVALPAVYLPDLETSRRFLDEFLKFVEVDLRRRSQLPRPSGERGSRPAGPRPPAPAAGGAPPPSGPVAVKVTYLGPHTGNMHWVQEANKKKGLVKYGTPPNPLPSPGTEIDVYATNASATSPEYRWDKPARPPDRGKGPGKPPRGGPRGRGR